MNLRRSVAICALGVILMVSLAQTVQAAGIFGDWYQGQQNQFWGWFEQQTNQQPGPSNTPAQMPEPTAEPTQSPSVAPEPTPSPSPTPEPTAEVAPSSEPEPTPTLEAAATAAPVVPEPTQTPPSGVTIIDNSTTYNDNRTYYGSQPEESNEKPEEESWLGKYFDLLRQKLPYDLVWTLVVIVLAVVITAFVRRRK